MKRSEVYPVMCVINKVRYWKEGTHVRISSLGIIINRREIPGTIFQIPFFRVTCGAQIDQCIPARVTLEKSTPPGVTKRYRLTPISPQWFWNPKPRHITVPFSLSAYPSLCECWWYWYREKRKRWREKGSERSGAVHRAGRSGEFDKSRRVRIFVRQFFTSAERPRTRGTRFEHFSSSRTERNRPREIRSHVLCICRCIHSREKSLAISLNWRTSIMRLVGRALSRDDRWLRLAWFTDFKIALWSVFELFCRWRQDKHNLIELELIISYEY